MEKNQRQASFRQLTHPCLTTASEVFVGMLSQDMKEKREGIVTLPDTSRSAMRVAFRLLDVAHVEPSDWKHARGEDDGNAVK